MAGKSGFKVIIVGGGIAGLALANELQLAGVDFVLLEGRGVIDPQVGASIGMLPNGSRILDQVGCYEEIFDLCEPITEGSMHKADGTHISKPTDTPILMAHRSGYHTCFLDRQWVLRILADHVEDKGKIILNKRVSKIEQSEDKATVFCADGSSYGGDVVVGTDGVYSTVRYEMWRQADEAGEGKLFEKDKQAMFSEYTCMFGISTKLDGMEQGLNHVTFDKDRSSLIIVGKNGRIFWFIFVKNDKIYKAPNIPKYTTEDKAKFLKDHGDLVIRNDPRVTFNTFMTTEVSSTLVALEEAAYENWSYGRMVCAGDSIHKMTPNLGAGGNSAVESTAVLANQMKILCDQHKSGNPPRSAIVKTLATYQKLRYHRMVSMMEMANGLTRIHAMKTGADKFVAFYVIPNAGDYMADLYADFQVGAPKLEYLPPPPRSLEATMPFNEEHGWGFIESKTKRALKALPFIGIAIAFMMIVRSAGVEPHLEAITKSGKLSHGGIDYKTLEKFYPIRALDSIWRLPEAFFMSSTLGLDPQGHAQAFDFLIDVSTLYGILLVESSRRSNMICAAQIPVVFGILAQLLGGGFMLPLYFFLFYTYSPIGNFKASDNRLTNVWNTSSTFPVMFLFSLTPIYLMYQSPKLETRQYWSFAWQMFPVWVEIGQQVILKIMPDTMKYNRIYAPKADVTPVRLTVWTFTVISAAAWIYTLVTSPFSMADIFVPTLHPKDEFIALTRYFLQMDWIAIFGSAFLWLVYAFGDLKTAGMVHQGWATILGLGALSFVCVGPGATFALGWLWREETLISKRHKKAVIWESLSEEDKKAAGAENVALDGNTKVRNGYANGATNGHAKKH